LRDRGAAAAVRAGVVATAAPGGDAAGAGDAERRPVRTLHLPQPEARRVQPGAAAAPGEARAGDGARSVRDVRVAVRVRVVAPPRDAPPLRRRPRLRPALPALPRPLVPGVRGAVGHRLR